ncbi:Protein of unknown function [Propionibacterium freudenreichii]|nr:Protein of unknown function [Propionibacterium freudenreichii]
MTLDSPTAPSDISLV